MAAGKRLAVIEPPGTRGRSRRTVIDMQSGMTETGSQLEAGAGTAMGIARTWRKLRAIGTAAAAACESALRLSHHLMACLANVASGALGGAPEDVRPDV